MCRLRVWFYVLHHCHTIGGLNNGWTTCRCTGFSNKVCSDPHYTTIHNSLAMCQCFRTKFRKSHWIFFHIYLIKALKQCGPFLSDDLLQVQTYHKWKKWRVYKGYWPWSLSLSAGRKQYHKILYFFSRHRYTVWFRDNNIIMCCLFKSLLLWHGIHRF